MGRYKQNYSLYPRKFDNGRVVWYYRTYTPEGKRTVGKSTMCSSKTKARLFCEELIKQNLLYDGSNLTFGMYAENWFEEGSLWFKEKMIACNGKPFSKSTLLSYRCSMKLYILPFFKNMRLKDIVSDDIKDFRNWLLKKNLSQTSIKLIMVPLKTILRYAYDNGFIIKNPFDGVLPLKGTMATHDAFSVDEAVSIITSAEGQLKYICLIAALTGMRKSEIFGLRYSDFKEDYIDLKEQFLRGERLPLKTKEARKIPVCKELKEIIFKQKKNKNYVFSYYDISRDLKKILARNNLKDIQTRKLSFHSWRHFFNTYMASNGVDGRIIAAVSGHSTGVSSVQSVYINFKIEDYKDIMTEQTNFIKMLNKKQCFL